jgi:hypothetical protein
LKLRESIAELHPSCRWTAFTASQALNWGKNL